MGVFILLEHVIGRTESIAQENIILVLSLVEVLIGV